MRTLLLLLTSICSLANATSAADVAPSCNNRDTAPAPVSHLITASTPVVSPLCSPCPPQNEVLLAVARRNFDQQFPKLSGATSSVVGEVSLSGAPELIELTKKILSPTPPPSWPSKAGKCGSPAEVKCALSQLLGSEEAALRALTITARTGYPVSLKQTPTEKKVEQLWSLSEIRIIDNATQKFPPALLNLPSLTENGFIRIPDHYRYHDPNEPKKSFKTTSAVSFPGYCREKSKRYESGHIVFHETAFSSAEWAEEAILHELAHHYDNSGPGCTRRRLEMGWDDISGPWTEVSTGNPEKPTKWIPATQDGFADVYSNGYTYSKTNAAEDFASHVAYYIVHPEKTKKLAPQKFSRLKTRLFEEKTYDPLRWPELDSVLASIGGPAGLMQECAKTMLSIAGRGSQSAAIGDGSDVLTWTKIKTPPDGIKGVSYSYGYPLSSFATDTQCLDNVLDRFVSALAAKDPMFCEKGGEDFARKQIRARLDQTYSPLFQAAVQYRVAANAKNLPAPGCEWEALKTRVDCFEKHYLKPALPDQPWVRALQPNERRALAEAAMRLLNAK